MSITLTVASELISPEIADMAAAKMTAMINPTTPGGRNLVTKVRKM